MPNSATVKPMLPLILADLTRRLVAFGSTKLYAELVVIIIIISNRAVTRWRMMTFDDIKCERKRLMRKKEK